MWYPTQQQGDYMTILICISAVFMKQHSVLDIFAAIPICILGHFLFFRKEKDEC